MVKISLKFLDFYITSASHAMALARVIVVGRVSSYLAAHLEILGFVDHAHLTAKLPDNAIVRSGLADLVFISLHMLTRY
jgi:hypothetical protein